MTEKKPKISIVTINYNDRVGLEKTILSVRNQISFEQIEYIIIDAASKDGSLSVIQKYSDLFSFWLSEPDLGIYYGQNKGILNSKGEYILFLNSGDTLASENTLSEILSFELSSDLIYGDMLIESKEGNLRLGRQPPVMTLSHLLLDTIWHPACLIKRKLFEQYGLYDLNFRIAADYEFWLKIFSAGVSTKYIPVIFSRFNLQGLSSAPQNQNFLLQERKRAQSLYFNRVTLFLYRDLLKVIRFLFSLGKFILRKTLILLRTCLKV
ncbi:glycosyltransferase family 2 protein [Leptospira mayottensis]|uniref:Glycosyltransferase, group 2 family protein n=2 Tax=Leptospira mayottensis TaxID=1137606 RepID=A0AA87MR64_9LEPT|nr:glycosyltransferase family 2 protein [Leptospira mayottensis]AXR61672.1 glycosyltransferase [Leptospira mayottensis]AXR65057.1 glycosyltransferase [Leptospira mayottensis]AZQ01882.1 glycosyltransferase [Leptospira mayottensis 200901116]EKS00241.1 glycosyltransferase, group 2 family protein [Leptospira mayottensis 200901122]TGM89570.1 glycosyltransferase [Leptospira mayottensis]